MNCFILFKLKTDFTVWAGPQVGPGRFQAGGWPEAVGLVAGPCWALGRAGARGFRPFGRSRPGARRRRRGDRGTVARGGEGEEEGGCPGGGVAHQEHVGVVGEGRGRPRRPEFVEDERGERRTVVGKMSSISSVPRLPACVRRWWR